MGTKEMVEPTLKTKGIGVPIPRREDERLLRGLGRYTSDHIEKEMSYGIIVRSPYAHAKVKSIDISKALISPGVLAVLSGQDLRADGIKPIPHNAEWSGAPDAEIRLPKGFCLFKKIILN